MNFAFRRIFPMHHELLLALAFNAAAMLVVSTDIWSRYQNYIHTFTELVCIFIAVSTFLVGWCTSRETTNINNIVGLGFLMIAILSLLHTYFFAGLNMYPEGYFDLSSRYGVLARMTEALFMLIITIRIPEIQLNKWVVLLVFLALSFWISFLVFLVPGAMPVLAGKQGVTLAKKAFEYLSVIMLVAALKRLYEQLAKNTNGITKTYVFTGILFAIPAGIFLTLYRSHESMYYLSAHLLRLTFYYYILKGIVISSIIYPYKKLEEEVFKRQKIEEALLFSERRFFQAFHASPDIMAIVDLETKQYIDVNETYLRIFGFTREEVIGRKPAEVVVRPQVYESMLKELAEKGRLNNREADFYNKSGQAVKLLVSYEIIEINGQKLILCASKDVTELTKLQQEMKRLDCLNLVGQMSAGISHEIRNPLTTVRGFLQMLDKKEEDRQKKEYFNIMIAELDRCNSIISEFLSLARRKTMHLKAANLNRIIESIYPLLLADAVGSDKNIILDKGKIPELLVDEQEIRQLIFNLARNGLEAMTPGGTLTISTFGDAENIILAIADQGKGIPPDALPKLGTPFFTTKTNGTGLGLAVCYNIVDRHNASVEVRSSASGTTFYVRFKSNRNLAVDSKVS